MEQVEAKVDSQELEGQDFEEVDHIEAKVIDQKLDEEDHLEAKLVNKEVEQEQFEAKWVVDWIRGKVTAASWPTTYPPSEEEGSEGNDTNIISFFFTPAEACRGQGGGERPGGRV